jgi:hypothetical protein
VEIHQTAGPLEGESRKGVYVTSERRSNQFGFGPKVVIGEGTSFLPFLRTLAYGTAKYDPGLNLTLKNGNLVAKRGTSSESNNLI